MGFIMGPDEKEESDSKSMHACRAGGGINEIEIYDNAKIRRVWRIFVSVQRSSCDDTDDVERSPTRRGSTCLLRLLRKKLAGG